MRIFPLITLVCSIFLISCSEDDSSDDTPIVIDDQNTPSGRYAESIFDEIDITRAVQYGNATTLGGVNQDLELDFYEPSNDTEQSRPLLILAHGGSFISGTREDIEVICNFFARSGYAVASISYRLNDDPTQSFAEIHQVLDATHDMKASIRFFKLHPQEYRIDTNNIFIGGFSAGAVTALHTGYMQESDISRMPASSIIQDYLDDNGGIEGNSGSPGASTEIKGVFNYAGLLIESSIIDAGEPILYSVHSVDDEVVSFGQSEPNSFGISLDGSSIIHQETNREGILNELNTLRGLNHIQSFICPACYSAARTFIANSL